MAMAGMWAIGGSLRSCRSPLRGAHSRSFIVLSRLVEILSKGSRRVRVSRLFCRVISMAVRAYLGQQSTETGSVDWSRCDVGRPCIEPGPVLYRFRAVPYSTGEGTSNVGPRWIICNGRNSCNQSSQPGVVRREYCLSQPGPTHSNRRVINPRRCAQPTPGDIDRFIPLSENSRHGRGHHDNRIDLAPCSSRGGGQHVLGSTQTSARWRSATLGLGSDWFRT